MTTSPILVLGGTGKTGRRILQRLEALGHPTRCGSRSAEPAFDWKDRSTWPAALEGARAAYISYYPDLAVPGAVEDTQAFARLALEMGCRRLVLLSGRGEPEAQAAEQALQATDADWTLLRASWFLQNFSENFLLDAIQSGTVALPIGDVKEPFIDADDIADVAVAALTEPGHSHKLYELTGPQLLTFAEAIATIAQAAGRPIHYVQVTPEQYAAGLAQADLPDGMADLVMYLLTTVMDGRNETLADGVQRCLGRAPRNLQSFATATAATGIWAVPNLA